MNLILKAINNKTVVNKYSFLFQHYVANYFCGIRVSQLTFANICCSSPFISQILMNEISYKGEKLLWNWNLRLLLTVAAEKCKPKWTVLQTLKCSRQNYYFIPCGPLSLFALLCHRVSLTPVICLIGFSLMLLLANDSAFPWGWQKWEVTLVCFM